ncbi:General secretion pathway protein B [Klebsiella pneumoniae subsp. pneumoniae ST258-K28BO]|nr:General secretion pathway protein B [Klebsiella pneumoniae subsp. pneumoniae ST258-K28BO]
MIVRDDSERGIPPLVTHQPPSSMDDAPVIRGRMVQIPGWIIPLYAGLFIALGWFGGEQWRHPAPPQTLPLPVAHAALLPLTAAGRVQRCRSGRSFKHAMRTARTNDKAKKYPTTDR